MKIATKKSLLNVFVCLKSPSYFIFLMNTLFSELLSPFFLGNIHKELRIHIY